MEINGSKKISEIIDSATMSTLNITDSTLIAKAGAIEAWIGADSSKNKTRSAYTEVAFNDVEILSATQSSDGTIKDAKIYRDADGVSKAITATAQEITKGNNKGKYNVAVSNSADCIYEVAAGDSTTTPDAATKTVAVKKGKTVTLKNLAANKVVYVRLAADTNAKIWSSDFVKLGMVSIPGADSDIKIQVDKVNSGNHKLTIHVTPKDTVFTITRHYQGEWGITSANDGKVVFEGLTEAPRGSFYFTTTVNGKLRTYYASGPIINGILTWSVEDITEEYPNGIP